MFPCFDEPEYKAVFHLQVTHHKKYSALSNSQVESRTLLGADDRVTTSFEPTKMMSTYMLALFVSDFSRRTNSRTNHSVYYRSNAKPHHSNFAHQMEKRILRKYEEYTGIPFEIGKMDLVAVPKYTGALENWASIFFEYAVV